MKLTGWAILVLALSVSAEASGFIPEMLRSNAYRAQLRSGPTAGLESCFLDEPANIHTESAQAVFEYNAENLLRIRTGGRLTDEIKTWGGSESLFIPLRIANRPTIIALSHTLSNASLHHDDDTTGTDLAWKSDSDAWAINHSIGSTRIGIAGSGSRALAQGQSLYPTQIFNIFTGWTPVSFRLEGRKTLIQIARPLGRIGEVCMKIGAGTTRLRTDIGEGSALLTIPAETDTSQQEINVTKRLNKRLIASVGWDRSAGSGSNSIYRNEHPIGKLRYEPDYRRMSASLRYQRRPDTVWVAGFESSRWDFGLHGLSIDGKKLGLNLKTFGERVDFNADTSLVVHFAYIGMQRQMSEAWSWGWHYRLGRIESTIDADYVGRAFFGLISISGAYDRSFLATRIHGVGLSARYAHKRVSVEARLEQVIPQSSGSGSGSGSAPKPTERSSSTGGTSMSLISGYAF